MLFGLLFDTSFNDSPKASLLSCMDRASYLSLDEDRNTQCFASEKQAKASLYLR
jgi:hypothetical protein